jgi:hypothetical protein
VPIELLDVAGLVPGAHMGRGLGNKFLDDLRHADGLVHVVDVSGTTDAEGVFFESTNEMLSSQLLSHRQGNEGLRSKSRYCLAQGRNCEMDIGELDGEMVCFLICFFIFVILRSIGALLRDDMLH